MKNRTLIVFSIVGFAALLRLFLLTEMPPHLNWDEVSHGYNAYSILKTGQDEWGEVSPLTSFRAFGDYKLPLYIYLTVPFVWLFGLSEWAVRLPAALAGVGSVIFTFLLVQKLFSDYKLAVISALLLTISPWHLMISRAAFEANLSLLLVILASWLFFKGIEKPKFLFFSLFFYGLSLYAYNSAKVFVPILIAVLIVLYRRELGKNIKFAILSILLFVLLFIPHLILLPTPEGQARFYWATILDQGAINQINQTRAASNLPSPLPTIFYNKPIYFTSHFLTNWLTHYSPQFLFLKGGSHYQYSIPGRGVAYSIEALFLLVGLFGLLFLRKREVSFVLVWFVIGPIAASVTRESPNVLRSILTLPSLQIITAYGILAFANFLTKFSRGYYFAYFLVLMIVFSAFMANFLTDYFGQYRRNYSFAWQYGYEEIANYIAKHYASYDRMIITKKYGEPHEFLLFYLNWSPEELQNDPNLVRYYRSNWYWVDRFDKFYFVNDWEIKEKTPTIANDGKNLLISSPDNFPNGAKKLDTVYFLDGQKAFEIFSL